MSQRTAYLTNEQIVCEYNQLTAYLAQLNQQIAYWQGQYNANLTQHYVRDQCNAKVTVIQRDRMRVLTRMQALETQYARNMQKAQVQAVRANNRAITQQQRMAAQQQRQMQQAYALQVRQAQTAQNQYNRMVARAQRAQQRAMYQGMKRNTRGY